MDIQQKRVIIRKKLYKKFPKEKSQYIEKIIFQFVKKNYDSIDVYPNIAYKILGEIYSNPENIEVIIDDLSKNITGWDSNFYKKYSLEQYNNILKRTEKPTPIEDKNFKCNKKDCKSKSYYYHTLQTRKGDEGATVYIICSVCADRRKR